ncbi:MATE family efflux transporter [Kordiimonas aquimaris]|uniref:MATE family efflux transporter n=1 Tax=Kordiimonas aquimaris TaxID=707591 RepID=UPI0021CF85E7|nr:MATE family efflux transporter [Kordiimonas aquimaris]
MTILETGQSPQKVILPDNWQDEARSLLSLGIPMALTQLAAFAVYTVDVLMIGRISPEDLAAASLGTVIYFALWMVGAGPVMAVSPLVSQALGADQNDTRDVRRSVRMALWVIFLMFPVVFGALLLTEPIALALGQDAGVSAKAANYVLALAVGWPFALATMALRNFLAALGKTKVPLVLVVVTTLINAGLNYVLIFGHFGVPRLELVGAGIASSMSYTIGFFLFVAYIAIDKQGKTFDLFQHFWRSDWVRFREVVSLGWPISMTTIFEGMLFNTAVILMGLIGIMEVAAYQISINVVALAFMLPWGISMAGAVRVGLAEGAGNRNAVQRSATVTMVAAILSVIALALILALFPNGVAAFYLDTEDPANAPVIKLVLLFLPIAAAFMVFDAAQVAANQVLRGLKDVQWPMYLCGVSYWLIGFPVAAILGASSLGAVGIWYGLTAGLIAATILLGGRLWWLAWLKKT